MFIKRHFHDNNKDISEDTTLQGYQLFEGIP